VDINVSGENTATIFRAEVSYVGKMGDKQE
jgi:hypothetical protein